MRFKIGAIIGVTALISFAGGYFLKARLSCPSDLLTDTARESRIVRLLDTTDSGRRLLAKAPRSLTICFDASQSGFLRSDGIAVLSKDASNNENAARLGHLLFHLARETPWPSTDRPPKECVALIEGAIEAEARAYELENALRKELRMDALPGFDRALWKRTFDERCHNDVKHRP